MGCQGRVALDGLLAEVALGSKLLYNGLPASCLDRQPPAGYCYHDSPRAPGDTHNERGSFLAVCVQLQISALNTLGVCCTDRSKLCGSRLRRYKRRWCGPKASGVQCSTGYPSTAVGRSLRRAAGGATLPAGIKGGCASASHPGSRRLRMWRRRPLVPLQPPAVPHSRQRICLGGPPSLLQVLLWSLAALLS